MRVSERLVGVAAVAAGGALRQAEIPERAGFSGSTIRKQLTVTAHRCEDWWALECFEYPSARSEVRRLDHAAETISGAIEYAAAMDRADFVVRVIVEG